VRRHVERVFTDRKDPIFGAGGSCSEISDLIVLSARRSHAMED
jgi:hypothetical protein